jgi:hypothetical protein
VCAAQIFLIPPTLHSRSYTTTTPIYSLCKRKLGDMLETPEERAKLLRAGLTGKEIESLYIQGNGFKIVGNSEKRAMGSITIEKRVREKTAIQFQIRNP